YSRANPAPWAGAYTVLFPGQDGDPTLPTGDGFGTVRVAANGTVFFAGTLADGTHVSQSVPVSRQGLWPLYASLYTGRGTLMSWMTFTSRPNDDINGIADWIKLPDPQARYYPTGFATESEAAGSIYLAPATAAGRVLNLTSASAIFAGGNLAANFANSITLGVSNKVTNLISNPLTLNFKPANGTVIGSC